MTRKEQLKFCKRCLNRKMDPSQGLICSITYKKADFEHTCDNFRKDYSVPEEIYFDKISNADKISLLSDDVLQQLRPHQNLGYALLGGFLLSILSALGWAIITVSTEFQIGYMAVAVGLIIGLGVRFFGAGVDQIYGYLGAFLSLFGCLLGNLLGQVGFMANANSMGYISALALLDFQTVTSLYQESFSIIDLVFYGIAIFEGYKFAFRKIPTDLDNQQNIIPALSGWRLPLVLLFTTILLISGYAISKKVNDDQVFYYEHGSVQAKGKVVKGVENGLWNYYYLNGNLQVVANYQDGIENGYWEWYYESGTIMQKGFYKNGLQDGSWMNYDENGQLIYSSNYHLGRLSGLVRSYYNNGQLMQAGLYERDLQSGEWKFYHDNGNLSAIGSYKDGENSGVWQYFNYDGSPAQILDYTNSQKFKILDAWDLKGNKIVAKGRGTYITYYDESNKFQEGTVFNGNKTGNWTTFYRDGKVQETGVFNNDVYFLKSAWNDLGEIMVKDGNGEYLAYFETTPQIAKNGNYVNGLRDGNWLSYYPNSTQLQQEINYRAGKFSGRNVTYYSNGNILTEGIFENDKRVGEWKWYYESGQLQCTVKFKNGEKEGEQIFWSESGRMAKKETYDQGKLVSEVLL